MESHRIDNVPVREIEFRGYRKYGKEYRCTLLSKPNRLDKNVLLDNFNLFLYA